MRAAPPPYCPDAGDIIWLDFNPQTGREQAGRRPALVLTKRKYNQASQLCVLCPITGQPKGYPFEVAIPADLPVAGVVLADQVKSLCWHARNAQLISVAPPALLGRVRGMIKALLQIP
ncbi:MAG TPA: endoribonuclease MazF [Stellaceae bacterium]|nr:endoribonuclease MazF [Stellaceae bacterium]